MTDRGSPSAADVAIRSSAGVIPVRPGGAVLLQLRDNRPDVGSGNCWGVLGGYVEPGESAVDAAWREIEEEVGVRPDALTFAGYFDHGSLRAPATVTIRLHLYGARAAWGLDDLILGEGQAVDWFMPAEALALALAPPLVPAITTFLASDLYRGLAAGDAPVATPPLSPLDTRFLERLALAPGALVVLIGATAGFGKRLRLARPDMCLTASPGANERPAAVLLGAAVASSGKGVSAAISEWRGRLAVGGALWLIRADAQGVISVASAAD